MTAAQDRELVEIRERIFEIGRKADLTDEQALSLGLASGYITRALMSEDGTDYERRNRSMR